jgi:putative FmdB family regulatory protein
MPTYEYECTHCGHGFEAFQKMTDKPLDKCPKCGYKIKRLIGGGSGIIFKGPGFYATDYRKKPKKTAPDTCPKAKEGCDACEH